MRKLYTKHGEEIKDLSQITDMVQPICDIEGSMLKDLYIGGKKYWHIDEDIPYR